MDFAITRGAKLQKFTGDEFDIGNADEDDLYDLLDDIYHDRFHQKYKSYPELLSGGGWSHGGSYQRGKRKGQ